MTAACKGAPLHEFFPDRGTDPVGQLKKVRAQYCDACPMLRQCARAALDTDASHGIWAGVWIGQNTISRARHRLASIAGAA